MKSHIIIVFWDIGNLKMVSKPLRPTLQVQFWSNISTIIFDITQPHHLFYGRHFDSYKTSNFFYFVCQNRAGQLVIDFDGDAMGDTLYPKNQGWTSLFDFGSSPVPHRPFFTYVVNFASYRQFFWENPFGQWGDGHRAMIFGGQIGYQKISTFS